MPSKTFVTKPADINREWWVVDAEGQTLGRLATQIATVLRGKNKPTYSPHLDTGDFVVVVNCEKVAVTGNRMEDKKYYRHSGYFGGLTEVTLRDQLVRKPEAVLREAVRGMLPKGPLGRAQLAKLKIYAGAEHPHSAQQPQPLKLQE
jgi:large subunit ribosomal protein L13